MSQAQSKIYIVAIVVVLVLIVIIVIVVVCIVRRYAKRKAGERFNPTAARRAEDRTQVAFEGKADFDDLKKGKGD